LTTAVVETLPLFARGKVRDTYDLGDSLLMVASDRISAFDVVLPTPIPEKGWVLTQMSLFWFRRLAEVVPNHLEADPERLPAELRAEERRALAGRSLLVRKAERIDVECVVRGFLAGTGWKDYQRTGAIGGRRLPSGLREADRLPEAIFTPTTKAETGHDDALSPSQLRDRVGNETAERLEAVSLSLYRLGAAHAERCGLLLADTKMEFGLIDGRLTLIDELLTPDSSRFWDAGTYAPGSSPPSYDKQFVRDYLETLGWDKRPPAPALPAEVVHGTQARYREAFARIAAHV
jgi:phosphoribosylaminoimidazole-succinocarboxamide synthase